MLFDHFQDLLIVNASMGADDHLLTTSSKELNHYLDINVTGTHRAVLAFLPALRARQTRKIVFLCTSFCGSCERAIKEPFDTFNGPYAVSKVALNMLAIQFQRELAKEGFTVIPIGICTSNLSQIMANSCCRSRLG